MGNNILKVLTEKYPFITLCAYAGVEYLGVIQNRTDSVTTLYDFGSIQDPELKRLYLDLASIWYYESNRSIPINIFLKTEWDPFKPYLKTFNTRDLDIIHGLACSLNDIAHRKSKRRSISLVRKIN